MGFLSDLFSGKRAANNTPPAKWDLPEDGRWSCPENMTAKDLKAFANVLKSHHIAYLSIPCYLSGYPEGFFPLLAKELPKTEIRSLNLNADNCPNAEAKKLFAALPETKIQTLKFKASFLKSSLYKDLAEALPHSNVTELNLCAGYYEDKEIEPLLKNLSPKVVALNLSMNKAEAGITKSIGDASVETLLPQLKNAALKRLDLCDTNVTDKHIPELVKIVSDPKTALSSVILHDSDVSDEMRMNMSRACRTKSRNAVLQSWKKDLPPALLNEQLPPMEDIRRDGTLPLIAKAGRLPELMERQVAAGKPLTAADLTTRGNDIPPAMAFIRRLGDFEQVFAPNLWTNVKEMQKAWDYFTSPLDKSFLDGKDGRPSFKNMKAQAAANAVKTVLKTKER